MSSNPARPELGRAATSAPRILGVDPGSITTGWGLIGGAPAHPECVDAGVIRLGRAGDDLPGRLLQLHRELEGIVQRLRPTGAAVESPYHGSNARSAIQLAQARGVVLVVLAAAGLAVHAYTPATVKKAVTGNGRAPKQQVRAMVERLLARPDLGRAHDLTDALAVAICHASSERHRGLLEDARRGRPEGGALR